MKSASLLVTCFLLMGCQDVHHSTLTVTDRQSATINVLYDGSPRTRIVIDVDGDPTPLVTDIFVNDRKEDKWFDSPFFRYSVELSFDSVINNVACEIITSEEHFEGHAVAPVYFDTITFSYSDTIPLNKPLSIVFHGGKYDFITLYGAYDYLVDNQFQTVRLDTLLLSNKITLPASLFQYDGSLYLSATAINGPLPRESLKGNLKEGSGYIWSRYSSYDFYTFEVGKGP